MSEELMGLWLPCPFCGDAGDKGEQQVTMMNAERGQFTRIICRCCGAMAPKLNWQSRADTSTIDDEKLKLRSALETIAGDLEGHPCYIQDASDIDIQAAGGESAFVTFLAQLARRALG